MDKSRTLERILPHLCLSEWGDADTETIMRILVLCDEKKIRNLSVCSKMFGITKSMAANVNLFSFSDNIDENPTQLFVHCTEIPADYDGIIALSLKNTSHLDIEQIVSQRNSVSGFLFIDENGNFLHNFYDFLNTIDDSFNGQIQYCAGTNNLSKLAAALTLVEKIRPSMLKNFRIFVTDKFWEILDNDLELH